MLILPPQKIGMAVAGMPLQPLQQPLHQYPCSGGCQQMFESMAADATEHFQKRMIVQLCKFGCGIQTNSDSERKWIVSRRAINVLPQRYQQQWQPLYQQIRPQIAIAVWPADIPPCDTQYRCQQHTGDIAAAVPACFGAYRCQ